MARMNKTAPNRSGSVPLKTVAKGLTHEGGVGFVSDTASELFRLGATLLGNDVKGTFYEGGKARDDRFNKLTAQVALEDPAWVAGFLPYLRREANIRTASIMGSAAAVHSRLSDKHAVREDQLNTGNEPGTNRLIVNGVLNRADEPGEAAFHYLQTYGHLPKALKRALGDAAQRLWNPYSVQKYDTASHGLRFADVMNLAHFTLTDPTLAAHIINRRYGNPEHVGELPEMIAENISLRSDVANGGYSGLTNPARLRAAGFTWEDALSLAGNHVPKDKLWNALILGGMVPIFATVRNLRNFDEAGISNEAMDYVHKQLTNPEVIAKSRMFPFRFLSAIEQLSSYTWHSDLETALQLSCQNVPVLDGRTLVLVDTSGSMDVPISHKSKMTRSGLSAFFGGAFAAKNAGNVDLYIFADTTAPIDVRKGTSALKLAEEMHRKTGRVGHGTQTGLAVQNTLRPEHKRVFIATDMQSFPAGNQYRGFYGYGDDHGKALRDLVPSNVHMYAWDVAGYEKGDIQSGQYDRTHQLAGYTDSVMKWIPMVERGFDARWPWLD